MISKIFPFLGRKKEPVRKDPVVKAEFSGHRYGNGNSNAAAAEDIGKILAKRFPRSKVGDFGTTVQGKLSDIERSIEAIGEDSTKKGFREQIDVRIDFKPGRRAA